MIRVLQSSTTLNLCAMAQGFCSHLFCFCFFHPYHHCVSCGVLSSHNFELHSLLVRQTLTKKRKEKSFIFCLVTTYQVCEFPSRHGEQEISYQFSNFFCHVTWELGRFFFHVMRVERYIESTGRKTSTGAQLSVAEENFKSCIDGLRYKFPRRLESCVTFQPVKEESNC